MRAGASILSIALFYIELSSGGALAFPIAHWGFDEPSGVAGTTDILTMFATLTNAPNSPENITSVTGAALGPSVFYPAYHFAFGPTGTPSFNAQFGGINLAPGESFSFIFGTFTPVGGAVPEGLYSIGNADLALNGFDVNYDDFIRSTTGFERTILTASVPEPSTLFLLSCGLLGLGLTRGVRRISRTIRLH